MENVKAKYGVKGPYLLFVGNIESKKNIEKLIHACPELRNSTIYKYPFLVVGKKAWYFQTVWEFVQQVHAENNTIFVDVVDGADLPYQYRGAELFIFPSLFEGFGIPIMEAMACGTIVASNWTSLAEINDQRNFHGEKQPWNPWLFTKNLHKDWRWRYIILKIHLKNFMLAKL